MKVKVKVEEINRVVLKLVDSGGFVDVNDLSCELFRLQKRHHELDKTIDKQIGNTIGKSNFRINRVDAILDNIYKYQERVRFKSQKSSLKFQLERYHKDLNVDACYFSDAQCGITFREGKDGYDYSVPYSLEYDLPLKMYLVKDESVVCTGKELCEILGISKPTLKEWRKNKVVEKQSKKLLLQAERLFYKYKNYKALFNYYDLDDIVKRLRKIK